MEISCSNRVCPNEPDYLIEFTIIGAPGKATMHLCEACWCKLWDRAGFAAELKRDESVKRSGASRESQGEVGQWRKDIHQK